MHIKSQITVFHKYNIIKAKLKIVDRDLEIYTNNYYNLSKDYCIKVINELHEKKNNMIKFINKYEAIYDTLSECEKVYIKDKCYCKYITESNEYFDKYKEEIKKLIVQNKECLPCNATLTYLPNIYNVISNKFSTLDNIPL